MMLNTFFDSDLKVTDLFPWLNTLFNVLKNDKEKDVKVHEIESFSMKNYKTLKVKQMYLIVNSRIHRGVRVIFVPKIVITLLRRKEMWNPVDTRVTRVYD